MRSRVKLAGAGAVTLWLVLIWLVLIWLVLLGASGAAKRASDAGRGGSVLLSARRGAVLTPDE